MFPKLTLLILSAALTAAALLVVRHRRIETAHEMSVMHAQLLEHERALWRLRGELARRCRPEAVREMTREIPETWIPMLEPREDGARPLPAPAQPPVGTTAARSTGIDETSVGG